MARPIRFSGVLLATLVMEFAVPIIIVGVVAVLAILRGMGKLPLVRGEAARRLIAAATILGRAYAAEVRRTWKPICPWADTYVPRGAWGWVALMVVDGSGSCRPSTDRKSVV